MVCSVCSIEKNESEFQKYWHSTQNKFRIRKQCSTCFYLRRKKDKLIQVPNEEEIVPQIEDMGQPAVLYEEPTHKVCKFCEELKPLEEFGVYTRNTKQFKPRCKDCERILESKKYRQKIEDRGGSERVPPKPNRYNCRIQKEQTFEFLTLLGWKFNEDKGIWFKDGIKTEDGLFINIKVQEKVKIPKQKPFREPQKQGRKPHKSWEHKDEIRKLRKEGWPFWKLAQVFKASQPTIREIVYSENEK
jgi:hypothetical protein